MSPFLSHLLLASLAKYSFENFEIWLLKYPPQKKTLENWLLIFFEYLFFIIFLNHHLAKKNSKEKKRKERGTFFKKYTHKTIFVFCCFLFLFCFFVFFFFGFFFLEGVDLIPDLEFCSHSFILLLVVVVY
jgi:hypothetical protein